MSAIHKSPIRRSQILDHVLAIAQRDARMAAGHFGFRIIRIQIDIRKNPSVRIPTANIGLLTAQRKLLAGRAPTFYYEGGVRTVAGRDQWHGSLLL